MSGDRVIDLTQAEAEVCSSRGGVQVDGRRIPLEDVAVVLLGNHCTVSGGALTMLAKYDVVVLNCDWRGIPDLVGYGWSSNSRVAARHRAQAEISVPRRKSAWQQIVRAKIEGQANNLELVNADSAHRLRAIRRDVKSGDTSNCEALAARIYWDSYASGLSFLRVPGSRETVNSMLDYGYTIMRGFVIQALTSAGLWPTYGLWHRNRSNTFVLADDLIEPFRPAVDHCVLVMSKGSSLEDPRVKTSLVGVTSQSMGTSDSTVRTCIRDFASQVALYCEGERKRLAPPIWRPSPGERERVEEPELRSGGG